MAEHEIASVCFAGFPGTDRHLRELARVIGLSRHVALTSPDPASPEIAFLRQYLSDSRPSLVLFGGWHACYDPLADDLFRIGVRLGIGWTSSPAQTDLSGEAHLLARLLEDSRISHWFFAGDGFAAPLSAAGKSCFDFPFVLAVPELCPEREPNSPPVLSFFFSPNEYRRKNVLASLLALAQVETPYVLHLNGLSRREEYRNLLETIRIPYVDLGWMDEDSYERALCRVDIGLQLSLAETFNCVAAEHMLRGIPVLVSPMVPCAHGLGEDVRDLLLVRDPDSPSEIATRIEELLRRPDERKRVGREARKSLIDANARNAERAREVLTDALARAKG
jgi:glycosyltransferase involved in cell wall biosynthesis